MGVTERTLKIDVADVRNIIPDITNKYVFDVGGSQYQLKLGKLRD